MIVVTGASGNIGSRMADCLMNADKKIRVVGRSLASLQSFVDRGAEAAIGSMEDSGFLTTAFDGATAVFAMIPPNLQSDDVRAYQNRIGKNIADAIRKAGVKHVVNLSSIGAHLAQKGGVVQGLHDQEERLNSLVGVNVVHLRAGFFMENLYTNFGLIRDQKIMGSSIASDLKFPAVATQDVAEVACELLTSDLFHRSEVRYVLGPEDISYAEMTAVIGRALQIDDLCYVQFPYAVAARAMTEMGLSASAAEGIIELSCGLNEGIIQKDIERNAETSTPTTIEQFSAQFASLYNKSLR